MTVAVDLPTAVGASLILASALLVKRLCETTQVIADEDVTQVNSPGQTTIGKKIPDGVLVFRIFCAFFFGQLISWNRRCGGRASCRRC